MYVCTLTIFEIPCAREGKFVYECEGNRMRACCAPTGCTAGADCIAVCYSVCQCVVVSVS